MNVIFGTGGFAREVDWLLHDLHAAGDGDYRIDAFVTDDQSGLGGSVTKGRPVFTESRFFAEFGKKSVNCFVALGSPALRRTVVSRLANFPDWSFPAVVHPGVQMDHRGSAVEIGAGTIVCSGAVLTTDIVIGRFVLVYLNCTIAHDARVGDFCTLSPGVHVSGNVTLGAGVFLGTGAALVEKLDIAPEVVIGAGAVVCESISEVGTYVGVPARRMRR